MPNTWAAPGPAEPAGLRRRRAGAARTLAMRCSFVNCAISQLRRAVSGGFFVQRDNAVVSGFGDQQGGVAPGPVERARRHRVLLLDVADLAAVGLQHDPADRDRLLALCGPSHLDRPAEGEGFNAAL